MDLSFRRQRRYFGGVNPTIVKPQQALNPTKIECRQGEKVPGCQKELSIPQQVTVGTVPTIIKTNNPYRDSIIITNTSSTQVLFVGPYYVSITSGQAIEPLQSFTYPTTAEVWGIVATGSLVCTFAEVGKE